MTLEVTLPQALRPSESAVAREVGEELVILHLESGEYFSLNGVGAFVWSRIAEGVAGEALIDAMVETYDVSADRAAADLVEFVDEMLALGLLVP